MTTCEDCSGAGMVPAGGWEPAEAVTDGYVLCPSCARLCSAGVGGDPVNGCESYALPGLDLCAIHETTTTEASEND